jgi:hypothetical protein
MCFDELRSVPAARGTAWRGWGICVRSPCALPLTEKRYLCSGPTTTKAYDPARHQGGAARRLLCRIDQVNQFTLFRDSCSDLWRVEDEVQQPWSEFPQSPFALNTAKTLHLLAANLIAYGVVDAQSCPGGGLGPARDWPTGCGLQRARTKMIEWQTSSI